MSQLLLKGTVYLLKHTVFKYTIKNIRLNVIKYDKEKKQEDVTILKAEICQKKLSISYRVRSLESRSPSETA